MANRPAPKRSSFGASHPIEHVEEAPPRVTAAAEPPAIEEPPASSVLGAAAERKKPGPAPKGEVKKKAALWADEDVIERIRGAWFHTPTTSGERELSFSDFLLEAALARTAEREQTYNAGKEFPRVPAGRIGPGRKS